MGSSTVMTWSRSAWMMWLMMAAMVVDFPLPVAPVTMISPRRASAMVLMTAGRLSGSKSGMANGMVRITAPQVPRCLKMLARKRETPVSE